jgi:hypothetical protein
MMGIDQKISKNKELFAEWLAVPKKMREPQTQKEPFGNGK